MLLLALLLIPSSVTKIGRNVAAFGNFEGLLRIWQKFESTLAMLLIFGEFLVLKWPKIEQS